MKRNVKMFFLAALIAALGAVPASAAMGGDGNAPKKPVQSVAEQVKQPPAVNRDTVSKVSLNEFFAFCAEGKVAEVEKTLTENAAYLNAKNDNVETPLMVCVRANQPAVVDALLKFNPNLEAEGEDGWTALMLAAESDRLEIAEKLIKAGANVNAGVDGYTALHAACRGSDDPKMVELLVASWANIEQQDDINEETPLMVALEEGHGEAARALLKAGADTRELPAKALTKIFPQMSVDAFFALCEEGKVAEVEKTLAENAAYLDAKNDNVETPLMACVRVNQPAVVAALLKFNPNLEAEGEDGWTALMLAAESDRLEIAEKLIKAGANVNAGVDGYTALHAACRGSDDPKMVELLVASGANIEQQDDINEWTPLMVAAEEGHTRVAEALAAAGARH